MRRNRLCITLASLLSIVSLLAPSFTHAATVLYVTNGPSDRITLYNTEDHNEEISSVSVGDQPIGIVISGTGAYTANSLSDTVSVIDVTNNQLVATITVGDNPHSIAVSGTGLYVTNSTSGTVTVIDTTDNQVVTTITVGSGPRNIAINGTGAYVANFGSNTVSVIDITDNQVVRSVSVGTQPHGLSINGTGAYVTNMGSNTVSIIDMTDNQVVRTFSVGSQPQGIAFYGTGAYVTNYNGDTVSIIDRTDYQVVTTISIGDGPTFVRVNGTGAYVTNYLDSTVKVIDVTTNTIDETITTTQPFDVAFYDDTNTLAPTLTLPASAPICNPMRVAYAVPEIPLSGSVRIEFVNRSTSIGIVLTMNDTTSADFDLNFGHILMATNVVSSTANSLAAGTYNVTLSYQDAYGNTANGHTTTVTVAVCTSTASTEQGGGVSGGGGARSSTLQARQDLAERMKTLRHSVATGGPDKGSAVTNLEVGLLERRTCERVNRWFRGNEKMLVRINERLHKRFGFECR